MQSFPVMPGDRFRARNYKLKPLLVVFECGDYGTIEVKLPINGAVTLFAGSREVGVFLRYRELEDPVGDNVIEIYGLELPRFRGHIWSASHLPGASFGDGREWFSF